MSLKFQLDRLTLTPVRVCGKSYSKTDRQTDRRTDTLTDRQIDRQTDTQADTQMGCPKPVFSTF